MNRHTPTRILRQATSRRRLLPGLAATAAISVIGATAAVPTSSAVAADAAVIRATAQSGDVTDSAGNLWKPDGSWATGGFRQTTTSSIRGTGGADMRLYQASRTGVSDYRIPVSAPGTYSVKMWFADQQYGQAGRRVFDVFAEGALKANDVDVAKEVGRLAAHQRWITVDVRDGALNLRFVAVKDRTMISAVQVDALSVTAPAASNSPTPVATTSPAPVVSASPTAAPTTTTPPLWKGDYETGSFSQFENAPWNFVPQAPSVVSSPVRDGSHAGRFTIPAGGNRSEVVPLGGRVKEGDERWYSMSTMLASGFPTSVGNWQVLTQWKNDGDGSPPLEISVANGQFGIGGGFGHPSGARLAKRSLGAAGTGAWDDWTVHVKFSSNTSVGFVEVWRNGQKVLDPWFPPGGTLYPGMGSYHKVGYYRDPAISQSGTVLHDRYLTGLTRASVGG